MYLLGLVSWSFLLGLSTATANPSGLSASITDQILNGRLSSDEVRDGITNAFDEDLKRLVRESCITSTEAILNTVKDRLLSDLIPRVPSPSLPPTVCCNNEMILDEFFDALGTGKREWRLAFRGTPNIGKSLYDAYVTGSGVPTNSERGCKQLNASLPCTNHYRNNRVLDQWEDIDKVALVVYKNNTRVQHIVFDAEGTSYLDWFQQSRLNYSSWGFLKTGTFNYFSIPGHTANDLLRRFFINQSYNGCYQDVGWFVVIDRANALCPWDKAASFPVFKYAATNHVENWATGDTDTADFIAIFVKYYYE